MSVVRASSKYQIAIPKVIRSKLGIKPGQRLTITESGGSIVVTPVPQEPIQFLCGVFKEEPSLTQELAQERKRDLGRE